MSPPGISFLTNEGHNVVDSCKKFRGELGGKWVGILFSGTVDVFPS
jgi:hypothetical protein